MKKRLVLAGWLSLVILLFISISSANAALQWYNHCTISAVGGQSGIPLIYASWGDESLPANYYALGSGTSTTEMNQFMATALTAISTVAQIQILVDLSDGLFYHRIVSIYTYAP